MNATEEIRWGLETAYIDGTVASNMAFKPQFVSNNYKEAFLLSNKSPVCKK